MSVTNAGGGSFAPSEYVGVCLKKTVPRRFLAQVRVGWPVGQATRNRLLELGARSEQRCPGPVSSRCRLPALCIRDELTPLTILSLEAEGRGALGQGGPGVCKALGCNVHTLALKTHPKAPS